MILVIINGIFDVNTVLFNFSCTVGSHNLKNISKYRLISKYYSLDTFPIFIYISTPTIQTTCISGKLGRVAQSVGHLTRKSEVLVIQAFSDFKAFLCILIGGFKAFLYILIGRQSKYIKRL